MRISENIESQKMGAFPPSPDGSAVRAFGDLFLWYNNLVKLEFPAVLENACYEKQEIIPLQTALLFALSAALLFMVS